MTSGAKNMEAKLVSVIITCYNHAHFLPAAIESVVNQSYQPIEIVVVDDGSVDNTREVAQRCKDVKYIYQKNQGLPAARNTGIAASTGAFLVFLDADDWLLPDAVATNLKHFASKNLIGLVSGNYIKYYDDTGEFKDVEKKIKKDVYADLLLYNHLAMHGAVMFPRFVFDRFQYDNSLRASEDWDLTLAISRHYPVVQHTEPVAIRRKSKVSMSTNHRVMLETGLRVLDKQRKHVRTSRERRNLKLGRENLKRKFTTGIYKKISKGGSGDKNQLALLLKHNPVLLLKYYYRLAKLKMSK